MSDLFSVVITTCNREVSILTEALESVLMQSYSNIEIIIINDAPENPQNTEIQKIIDKHSNKVKYFINKKQMGANYSRNYGMKISKGRYLSFLDDDDYWEKTRVQKFIEQFKKGYDIVYSDFIIFNKKNSRYSKRVYPKQKDAVKMMLVNNYLGGFSNVSFTRECFIKAQMLDENMPSYQDQDLFIRMLQYGRLGYISEALSYYRITENSISLNPDKKIRGLLIFLKKYSNLYSKYPESKKQRLEIELIYSAKQGWKNNKKEIKKLLLPYDSRLRLLYLDLIGTAKRIAINTFKVQ